MRYNGDMWTKAFVRLSLTLSYVIAFSLLAMWSLFAYLTMHSQINEQRKYAEFINVSGKQRMLSQRTALLAQLYFRDHDPKQLQALREHKEMMQRDHRYLMERIPSEAMREIYDGKPYEVHAGADAYFAQIDTFLSAPEQEHLNALTERSSALLPLLDHAVKSYERESAETTDALMRIEGYIFLGTLLTLILEAIFIIRPVLRRARWNLGRLDNMVRKQTAELEIFKNIYEGANEAILITDTQNRIVRVNPAFTQITGYASEEAVGNNPSILRSGHQDSRFYRRFWETLEHSGAWHGEFVNRKKDGTYYHQLSHIFALKDEEEKLVNHVAIFSDISQIRKSQQQLEFMAMHDDLTQLPNRTYLMEQITHAIHSARRTGDKVAVILLDLDNFKVINDSLSHRVGDLLLKAVGKMLRRSVRRVDTVARIGGDEFVLLVEHVKQEEQLIGLLEKVQQAMAQPYEVEGYKLSVTGSLGVAIYPDDAENPDQLLQYADTAMYSAKQQGKNQFGFFTAELNAAIAEKIAIEGELKEAAHRDEFHLVFQPIVRLEDETVVGFETLLRWNSERFGMVPPDQFIPIAESTGLIGMVDGWVMAQLAGVLSNETFDGYYFTLNVSSRQFSRQNFAQELMDVLNVPGQNRRVVLEVTETAIIDNIEHTKSVLETLKAEGFRVAIDDFGTGYSSLYYLKNLPIDYLKIDKSFVSDMEEDENDRIIIDSIISMARKMHLYVVAEGVETETQKHYLQERLCHFGQGYHFSRPVTADALKTRWKTDEEAST